MVAGETPKPVVPIVQLAVVVSVAPQWHARIPVLAPTIAATSSQVYVTSSVGMSGVFALSVKSGRPMWHLPNAGYSVAVGDDIITYVHDPRTNVDSLVALEPNTGHKLWQTPVPQIVSDAPLLRVIGDIVLSGTRTALHAYNAKAGKLLWRLTIDGLVRIDQVSPSLIAANANPLDVEPHGSRFGVVGLRDGSTKWSSYGTILYSDDDTAYVRGYHFGIPDDYEAAAMTRVSLTSGKVVADLIFRPAPELYQNNAGYWALQDRAFISQSFVNISLNKSVYRYDLGADPQDQEPLAASVGNVFGTTSAGHLLTDYAGVSDVNFLQAKPIVTRLATGLASSGIPNTLSIGSFQLLLTAKHKVIGYTASAPSRLWLLKDDCNNFASAQPATNEVVLACGGMKAPTSEVRLVRLGDDLVSHE